MFKYSKKQFITALLLLIALFFIIALIFFFDVVLEYIKERYMDIIIAIILAIIAGIVIEYIYKRFSPKSKILKTTMTHVPNDNGLFASLVLPNNNNIVVAGAEKIIGREDFLGVIPTDKLLFIGKNHFKITNMEDGFFIEDLDTKNGTFLNQEKLTPFKKIRLNEGDEILVAGNLHIKYTEKNHLR